MKPLSVTQLNNQIKALLESTFEQVSVEGEVSNITYHSSGHLYFTIKDSGSAIKCVMFRGNASKLKFRIERGMHIVCHGAVSLYTPRGDYQINCFSVTPAGEGALALAFEQLKKRLLAAGYFDEAHKKPMPRLPERIGIVTSATGAAIQDMLKVAQKRWPMVRIDVYNTVVQGDQAAPSIARNLAVADAKGYDVIVIGRGGGSMEDLWGFNEEVVAEAIYRAATPVVSAVGHEVDHVISDFVADLRAPTPSAAMEMLLPDQNEVLQYIDTTMDRLRHMAATMLAGKEDAVGHMKRTLRSYSVSSRVKMYLKEADTLMMRYRQAAGFLLERKEQTLIPLRTALSHRMQSGLHRAQNRLEVSMQRLEDAEPSKKLLPHTAQVLKKDRSVDLETLKEGESFSLTDGHIRVDARAERVEKTE